MIADQIAILVAIGFLAGICNALVGGGTLFTFPALLSVGLPPVLANTTTTVALWPGAVTSAFAYRAQLDPMRKELPPRILVAIAGGFAGAVLLLASGNAFFFYLVPWLLGLATLLFTFSRQIVKRSAELAHGHRKTRLLVMEFFSGIYGGYFGAAVGILLLAGMAVSGEDDIQSTNAQRNFLVCFINGVAVLLFVGSGVVDWRVALIVMVGSIAGGYSGARVAKRIPNPLLRLVITAAGAVFSVYYFVQAYG